mmetsp:Transcript_1158/g.2509  ORF Transcript_1158/g.2509 Transcript_1158/m.2509 type:complete len:113 (-) Transcript_1158:68-406(-)
MTRHRLMRGSPRRPNPLSSSAPSRTSRRASKPPSNTFGLNIRQRERRRRRKRRLSDESWCEGESLFPGSDRMITLKMLSERASEEVEEDAIGEEAGYASAQIYLPRNSRPAE